MKKSPQNLSFRQVLTSSHGSALIISILIMLIVAILIPAGTQLLITSFKEARYQEYHVSEAGNAARAGIEDTILWFRRQTNQPVRSGVPPTFYAWEDGAFDPLESSTTVKFGTEDESIGIVKEFPISKSGMKYARYEVMRQTDTAVSSYMEFAVHDITGERIHSTSDPKYNGDGLVWFIPSTGYIYLRRDSTKSYNESPNEVVAKARASTEIRRISLNTQGCASLVYNGSNAKIYNRGRVIGICGCVNAPLPTVYSGGQADDRFSGFEDPTPYYVFGLTTSEIKAISDHVVDNISDLPDPIPDMSLIFINGNATFNSANPLRASGILFVNGNLTLDSMSNSRFSGVVYVTGTATILDGCEISGSVIAYSGLTLSKSSPTDTADILFDSGIITSVRQQICNYREIKSSYRLFTGIK
ncbi:MAG: hypothetical protein JW871_00195 [Endomicrobiales bacterium]|nr:hypothetical protein [Endomicrobiales bacterium]